MSKVFLMVSSSVALGIGAYAAYKYLKSRESTKDEGFEDTVKIEENVQKILVLGLQSAGKTTLISQLTTGLVNVSGNEANDEFHVTTYNYGNKVLNFWDVSGKEKVRKLWCNFIQDTNILVFVVDSCDTHGFVTIVKEIKELAGDDRLKHVPILMVATKQDVPGALTPQAIATTLDVQSISPSTHKVQVLGTQLDSSSVHPSILKVKKAVLDMV